MKQIFILSLFFLISCGDPRQNKVETKEVSGKPGINNLIVQQKVTVSSDVCESSKGLIVKTGMDFNRNGILDDNEISQLNVVCDGARGSSGANGIGIVFTKIDADKSQCTNGGSVLIVASDTQETGVYSSLDENQSSIVVCNGNNGTNGTNGINGLNAPNITPITTIAPCGLNSAPIGKEQLLCLSDGNILSSFSDNVSGYNTRLAFIPLNMTLQDTDNSFCIFTATKNNNGDTTISWNGGSQTCKKQ